MTTNKTVKAPSLLDLVWGNRQETNKFKNHVKEIVKRYGKKNKQDKNLQKLWILHGVLSWTLISAARIYY